VGQFAIASIGAPLAGLGRAGTLLPMAVVMTGFAVLGAVAAACVPRRRDPAEVVAAAPATTTPA
jgi:DHA1 family bicyclomycin/chloramphenicol resistance-like MFS transporter